MYLWRGQSLNQREGIDIPWRHILFLRYFFSVKTMVIYGFMNLKLINRCIWSSIPAFNCSKSTMKILEECVKCVQVNNTNTRITSLASLWHLYCWLWTDFTRCSVVSIDFERKSQLGQWRTFVKFVIRLFFNSFQLLIQELEYKKYFPKHYNSYAGWDL